MDHVGAQHRTGKVRREKCKPHSETRGLGTGQGSCHLPGLCVAQSKIRAKLGWGPSSAACLPQVLFYIFIVWGQKRLLAVLEIRILPGNFFFSPIFISLEAK